MNKIVFGKNKFTSNAIKQYWVRFWMRYAGLGNIGRIATRFATWFAPPHKASVVLASMNPKGYIAPSAVIFHSNLRLGAYILIGDRVIIFQNKNGGPAEIGDRVQILRDTAIETGFGGSLSIGEKTCIHPRGQINAYKSSIEIGCGVQIAPNCAFYSYDHGFEPDKNISEQDLVTKGKIVVGDHAWLGVGVIVLSGVRIGKGAVVGAGSVVTHDIPDAGVAVGIPASVTKMRDEDPK
jgi:acetyltransferase-like isoleucine patch superfamily enzyme